MKKHITVGLKIHIAKMRLVLIGIFAIFSSCNGQKKASAKNMNSDAGSLITLVLQDNYSGSDTSEILVIKDSKRLKGFFLKVNKVRKPGLPVPEIDFSKEMLIVLCNGKQNKESWPSLYLLEETEEKMILEIAQEIDNDESLTASIRPFCIYKLPLTSKEIVFKEPE